MPMWSGCYANVDCGMAVVSMWSGCYATVEWLLCQCGVAVMPMWSSFYANVEWPLHIGTTATPHWHNSHSTLAQQPLHISTTATPHWHNSHSTASTAHYRECSHISRQSIGDSNHRQRFADPCLAEYYARAKVIYLIIDESDYGRIFPDPRTPLIIRQSL